MQRFRYGFIQMHATYDPAQHHAYFANENNETYIVGVDNLEQACAVAEQWAKEDKVDMIELCGAFGPKGAEAINQASGDRLVIGYAVHEPSETPKLERLFGKEEG